MSASDCAVEKSKYEESSGSLEVRLHVVFLVGVCQILGTYILILILLFCFVPWPWKPRNTPWTPNA